MASDFAGDVSVNAVNVVSTLAPMVLLFVSNELLHDRKKSCPALFGTLETYRSTNFF